MLSIQQLNELSKEAVAKLLLVGNDGENGVKRIYTENDALVSEMYFTDGMGDLLKEYDDSGVLRLEVEFDYSYGGELYKVSQYDEKGVIQLIAEYEEGEHTKTIIHNKKGEYFCTVDCYDSEVSFECPAT